jgi:hypothetical protein
MRSSSLTLMGWTVLYSLASAAGATQPPQPMPPTRSASARPGPPLVSKEGWIVGEIRAFVVPGKAEAAGILEEMNRRGWLECDGRSYEVVAYPALASVLGEGPAGGSASKTFRVPELRGTTPLSGGQPLRHFIYAGVHAVKAEGGAGATKPEVGLTLPPHYKMNVEVRLEGRILKSAAIIDQDAVVAPKKSGAKVAVWIINPPGCGQECEIARSVDGDRGAGTIGMQPCAARTACQWTFENTGSEARRFAFRFEHAPTPGSRLEPQALESSVVPTGPCVFVAWAIDPWNESTPEGAERTTFLVNVQNTQGVCDPASVKWN